MQPRSTFVTVLAWIFIALSGFNVLMAILQNIMFFTVFRSPEISQAMQAPAGPGTPAVAVFMMRHFQLFFVAYLLVSAFTLASAIGLLKRLNWARLCFIGLMVLGILWSLGGLVVQLGMFGFVREQFAAAPSHGGPDMQPFFIAMTVVCVIFAVGFSVLYGWIAKRLLSPAIAAEFGR